MPAIKNKWRQEGGRHGGEKKYFYPFPKGNVTNIYKLYEAIIEVYRTVIKQFCNLKFIVIGAVMSNGIVTFFEKYTFAG